MQARLLSAQLYILSLLVLDLVVQSSDLLPSFFKLLLGVLCPLLSLHRLLSGLVKQFVEFVDTAEQLLFEKLDLSFESYFNLFADFFDVLFRLISFFKLLKNRVIDTFVSHGHFEEHFALLAFVVCPEHGGPVAVTLVQVEARSARITIGIHSHNKLVMVSAASLLHLLEIYESAQVELAFDLVVVVLDNLRLELVCDLLVPAHNLAPRPPPNEPTCTPGDSAVDKLAVLIEREPVRSYHIGIFVAKRKLLFTVEIIADLVYTVVNEKHLVHLLELVEERCVCVLQSRLQTRQNIHHKVLVDLVIPSVKAVLPLVVPVREAERAAMLLDEVVE